MLFQFQVQNQAAISADASRSIVYMISSFQERGHPVGDKPYVLSSIYLILCFISSYKNRHWPLKTKMVVYIV